MRTQQRSLLWEILQGREPVSEIGSTYVTFTINASKIVVIRKYVMLKILWILNCLFIKIFSIA